MSSGNLSHGHGGEKQRETAHRRDWGKPRPLQLAKAGDTETSQLGGFDNGEFSSSWSVSQASPVAPSITNTDDGKTRARSPFVLRKLLTTLLHGRKSQQNPPNSEDAPSEEDLRGPLGLRLIRASPEPLIELIFVHGLRGGSVKTWRKGEDHRLFWPKFFLPMDPDFRNANIYSFGYDSDWGSTKHSILSAYQTSRSTYKYLCSHWTLAHFL